MEVEVIDTALEINILAQVLQDADIGTLLLDVLTDKDEEVDLQTRHLRFDIRLRAKRLIDATDWLKEQQNSDIKDLNIGYFGSSTGAAAALVAAVEHQKIVKAVVSRGGRPDLAGSANSSKVQASTLLIIGGNDEPVIGINKQAFEQLTSLESNKKVNNHSRCWYEVQHLNRKDHFTFTMHCYYMKHKLLFILTHC
jgi:putative phosphoribosyl transferase